MAENNGIRVIRLLPIEEFMALSLGQMLSNAPLVEIDAPPTGVRIKANLPKIVCVDGTTLSVQASRLMHCSPQDDNGPYTHVEVGYPSCKVPSTWLPYKKSPDEDDRHTIYVRIPIHLVLFFIGAHGGIDISATFSPAVKEDYKQNMRIR